MKIQQLSAFSFSILMLFVGCDPNKEKALGEDKGSNSGQAIDSQYLYVASGVCYSGGNTTFTSLTSSNQVYRIGLTSAQKDIIIVDYNKSPSQIGDSPVGLDSIDGNNLYILVENKTTAQSRRIERISKTSGTREIFSTDLAVFNRQVRDLVMTRDGGLLISKGNSIEKLSADNVRIKTPYIYKPAGVCANSQKLISKILTLNNGNIVYLHAAAKQNKIGIISSEGYTTVADCKGSQAVPHPESFPVAAVYDGGGRLIVAYSGRSTATDINSIYAYSVNEETNAISNPQKIYDVVQYPGTYSFMLYGISAMVIDVLNKNIYIATAVSTQTSVANYSIEKFDYHPELIGVTNTGVLSRVGETAFYPYGADTKCISALKVGP